MSLANDESAFQNWQDAYRQAILETDDSVLPKRIEAAQVAIKARLEELARDHGGTVEEQQSISDALRALDVLQKERAGGG